jgi:hypothetical protein
MGSLDLTAAFDVVNINLLIRRLKKLGLPEDWMELLEAWLANVSEEHFTKQKILKIALYLYFTFTNYDVA